MPTLCLGGSFNPIHHGHLIVARSAAEETGFDRVLLIPSGDPPHKPYHPELATPHARLAMCQAAVYGSNFFEVSDLEINRPGPSYTLLTVRELQQKSRTSMLSLDASDGSNDSLDMRSAGQIPEKIAWLIGADMLNNLPKWHDPAALLAEVRFVIAARPGFEFAWANLPNEFHHLKEHVVHTPTLDISSTEIRRRVRAHLSIDYLTPPAVVDYIRSNGLYQTA